MAQNGPGRTRSWLDTLLPVLAQGNAVTLLAVLLLSGAMIWGLWQEVHRLQRLNLDVVERLLAERQAQVEWLKTLARCAPEGR